MGDSAVIQTRDVSKDYGSVSAVVRLNLAVSSGEIFGFLGPNGAGKTTAIRMLTGFLRPTAGEIRVFGLDPWTEGVALKARLGFLPDDPSLYNGMKGEELLEYLGRLAPRYSRVRRRELCERLELAESVLRRRIKEYSHGMKQKLAIVQAMQHDPDLLIMDEPTTALDPLTQKAFFALLREATVRGCTVFFSSHVLSEVEQLCERVGIVREGSLVAVEEVDNLRRLKVRSMEVTFKGTPPDDLSVPGVEVISRNGRRWKLAVREDINPVIRALAGYELDDLVFEQPSLEDVFLDYYREDRESS